MTVKKLGGWESLIERVARAYRRTSAFQLTG